MSAVSDLFKTPKYAVPVQEPSEEIQTVVESASDTKKRVRKPTGRSSALIAGVQNALKRRLGE